MVKPKYIHAHVCDYIGGPVGVRRYRNGHLILLASTISGEKRAKLWHKRRTNMLLLVMINYSFKR